jgi:hypothetical protein
LVTTYSREAYCSPKSIKKNKNREISGLFGPGSLTLWVDPFVENEFAVPEEVEQWLKVVGTAVDEVGTTRVSSTRPA